MACSPPRQEKPSRKRQPMETLEELKRLRTIPKVKPAEAGGKVEATIPFPSAGRDVSAADVAQSLLTGRFMPNGDGSNAPEVAQETTPPAESGSEVISSSSLSLPGGESRGKSRHRRTGRAWRGSGSRWPRH